MRTIRRTTFGDIDTVLHIYERAVSFMRESGNPNQWGTGYPGISVVEADIRAGVSYLIEEDGVIRAVFSYIEGEDPTYREITQGAWRTVGRYGTIHRLASGGEAVGIAETCFAWCAERAREHGCVSLRADTHADNRIMQHLLVKNGFCYCGVIHLADGTARFAYERVGVAEGYSYAYGNGGGYGYGYGSALKQKGNGTAFGIASLVLGIISLFFFCSCLNWITGILAIIFGIIQLTRYEEKGPAIGGLITAGLSLFFSIMFSIGMLTMTGTIYEQMLNDYNYDDSYYYDDAYLYDDIYYDDFSSGQEFLRCGR